MFKHTYDKGVKTGDCIDLKINYLSLSFVLFCFLLQHTMVFEPFVVKSVTNVKETETPSFFVTTIISYVFSIKKKRL